MGLASRVGQAVPISKVFENYWLELVDDPRRKNFEVLKYRLRSVFIARVKLGIP